MNDAVNQLIQSLKVPVPSERELELSRIADEITPYFDLNAGHGEAYDQATVQQVEEIQSCLREELEQIFRADQASGVERAERKFTAIKMLLNKAEAALNSVLMPAQSGPNS